MIFILVISTYLFTVLSSDLRKLVIDRKDSTSILIHYINDIELFSQKRKRISIVNKGFSLMVEQLKNKSFTNVYQDNIIQIYSNADTARFSENIVNSTFVIKELDLYNYSNNIRHILTRIVLQPNEELAKVINSYNLSNCIGIQVRMGGKTASAKERVSFLKRDVLDKHLTRINQDYNKREIIFLSTDSESLINYIKRMLSNHKTIVSSEFPIWHSGINEFSHNKHMKGLKRAIVDAHITSQCNPIYTTLYSSFVELIVYLSQNHLKIIMKW